MRRVLVLFATAFAAAGCGGGGTASTPPEAPKALFVRACGACHTLAAAGTHGTAGPNLDDLRPSAQAVARVVEHGRGAMPAKLLDAHDTPVVAAYVARVARG